MKWNEVVELLQLIGRAGTAKQRKNLTVPDRESLLDGAGPCGLMQKCGSEPVHCRLHAHWCGPVGGMHVGRAARDRRGSHGASARRARAAAPALGPRGALGLLRQCKGVLPWTSNDRAS